MENSRDIEKILNKLEEIERRITKLESGSGTRKNKTTREVVHHNTIQPSEMELGRMAYVGRYESEDGSMGATFGADNNKISCLFKCNSFEMAKVIDAFSSEERIDIVKELIQRSLSARQLMDRLNFPTTGKLYHHLSFLQKIGVIRKDNDLYHVSAKYISCVLLIFTGVEKIIRNSANENQ